MIITKTPFRVSFFGGGTDYPRFFREHGGSVISTSIDKYCYVSARRLPPFFEYNDQVIYSKIEYTRSVNDIEHPAVREALKFIGLKNVKVEYDADLPARAGLGSSSSFTVGMLSAFHAMKGEFADKEQLASEAITVERELCGEDGGIQDQIAVAFGGLNRMYFDSNGFRVVPLVMSRERKDRLCKNLMLYFTGFSRFSSYYAVDYNKNIPNKTADMLEMLSLVDEAEKILCGNDDLNLFGELLNYTWRLKRGIADSISNDKIDEIYRYAIENGAAGGKLLGAGGGGFLLFYVDESMQPLFKEKMKDFMHVPFVFDEIGTNIIYSMSDTVYWSEENAEK